MEYSSIQNKNYVADIDFIISNGFSSNNLYKYSGFIKNIGILRLPSNILFTVEYALIFFNNS